MFIAQPTVAGEGKDRPLFAESSNDATDGEAFVEFTCDKVNLPWIIFRAAHRATHIEGLSTRSRALLAALARTVDADRPYAAVFARRELLTGRAMQSMRTFYRSLDDLEAAGLITRPPQKRYGSAGLFGRAYLHLTEQAAQILGLVATEQDVVEHATTHVSDDHQATDSSLEHRSAKVADGGIYKDLYPVSQKRQPGTLPADLKRLTSLGFREFLIFKLMREARQHGKFLSDVVEATWQHLKQAHAPISYLRALLRSTADFHHQVQTKRDTVDQARRQERETIEIAETLARSVGVFFDATGERRIEIGSAGTSMTVHDCCEARPRLAAGAWQAPFVNALAAGKIHRAHPVEEESFMARRRDQLGQRAPSSVSTDQVSRMTATVGNRLAELKNLLRSARASTGRPINATTLDTR
jgi:hypothetical protein